MAKNKNKNNSSKKPQKVAVTPVDGIILFQTNVKYEYGKRQEFIQHLVDNYYATGTDFNGCSQDLISEWVEMLIPKRDDDYEDNEKCKVKLPLIAKEHFFPDSVEYITKKHKKLYYLPIPPMRAAGPAGAMSMSEPEPDSSDKVFAGADQLITELRRSIDALVNKPAENSVIKEDVIEEQTEEGGTEKVPVKEIVTAPQENIGKTEPMKLMTLFDNLDVARNGEKKDYDSLRSKIIQVLHARFAPNPELESLRSKVEKLNGLLDSASNDCKKYKGELAAADEVKRRAVDECKEQFKKDFDDLKDRHAKAENEAKVYKDKFLKEEAICKGHETTIAERDATIKRLNEESRLYNERVVFFRPTQDLAKLSITFFDAYDELMAEAGEQKKKEPSNQNEVDNYNYYMARIERKFLKAVSAVKNLKSWRHELQMLAQTGLVPSGGIIDSKLGGNKVKESEWDSTLRMLLYHEVMAPLTGAAVVMCDEMAFMLPHQVPGVKGTDGFAKISERMQKAISAMGYELNYVKPFTKLSQYKDVENVKFTEADVPSGTIFEVIKMALNYGSSKSKTEVSSKE